MMSNFSRPLRLLASVAVIFLHNSAAADILYESDWKASGDNLLLTDAATGLQWLNLTVTTEQSFDQIQSQLSTTYAGFQFATDLQVTTLFGDAGIIGYGALGTDNPNVTSLLAAWGTLNIQGSQFLDSWFITGDQSASVPDAHDLGYLGEDLPNTGGPSWSASVPDGPQGYFTDNSVGNVGFALVRTELSPVPLPPSSQTFGLALAVSFFLVTLVKRDGKSTSPEDAP